MTASHFWVNSFFKIWERKSKKTFHQPFQRQHNYLQPTKVLRMTPATLSVPWSNSNSLPPHSQISEASRSCELTRWSGMGGSDPKDPSLTHPLLLSPRFLKWHLPAIHGDWGKYRTKTMSLVLRGGEVIYLWKSFLDSALEALSIKLLQHRHSGLPPWPHERSRTQILRSVGKSLCWHRNNGCCGSSIHR